MIEPVTKNNLIHAAEVHAASWRESHRDICTPEFIALHTAERQSGYLLRRMEEGAAVFLLTETGKAVGVVSVNGCEIGDLYVTPDEQGKGYGTRLLRFAMERCSGTPTLWVLNSNVRAMALYERHGFRSTGKRHVLSETVSEIEMRYAK